MYKPLNNAFAEIFGDVIKTAANSQQIIKDCTTYPERREVIAPSSVLVEERRRPVNIATVSNHDAECLRRIIAAGQCTCSDQEVEAAP